MAVMRLADLAVAAVITGAVFTGCVTDDIAGNGTLTGNPTVTGILYEPDGKTAAKNVRVSIRPRNTLADTSTLFSAGTTGLTGLTKRLADTATVITDDSGRFAFDSTLDTGLYVIEADDGGSNMALIDSVQVVDTDSAVKVEDTLRRAGAISGMVFLSEGGDPRKVFILAMGLDRFTRPDSTGKFTFGNLAEAVYDLTLISSLDDYAVLEVPGVEVVSGGTRNLDTLMLGFTGIPTPKNLVISYDTLNQTVVLSWDLADTGVIDGYNVYRAIKGQNFNLITWTPLPERTTVYQDSTIQIELIYEYRVVARNAAGKESELVDIAADTVKIVSSAEVTTTFEWGTIGTKNDTASINDTVKIIVSYANPTRINSTIQWYVDTVGSAIKETIASSLSGSDTLVYRWIDTGDKTIIVKITDAAGTEWLDSSMVIYVLQDVPKADAGSDTTVLMNASVALKGTATQQFGKIDKWEWNVDESGFKEVVDGAITVATPPVETKKYPCVLRVTDDDGNTSMDTLNIVVGKWDDVGIAAFSQGGIWDISLGFADRTPYVAYRDVTRNEKATVMKYDGNAWISLDPSSISNDYCGDISLAFDGNIPYVAYRDSSMSWKGTVMKYDGNIWSSVGLAGISGNAVGNINIAVDDGIPYVAYNDYGAPRKGTVKKYNGSEWVIVGLSGISSGSVSPIQLDIDNSVPFVAFGDGSKGYRASVMKYDGSSWNAVGMLGFSDSIAGPISLDVADGVPYVAYEDGVNGFPQITVMKYNGTAWNSVGKPRFSMGTAYFPSISIYKTVPYIAYKDALNGGKAVVMKYENNSWVTVGSSDISKGQINGAALLVENGNPYIAFRDEYNSGKVTVKIFH